MNNNWFCDRCHFYEDDECTNAWGCDSEFRSYLALILTRDVKETSNRRHLMSKSDSGQGASSVARAAARSIITDNNV